MTNDVTTVSQLPHIFSPMSDETRCASYVKLAHTCAHECLYAGVSVRMYTKRALRLRSGIGRAYNPMLEERPLQCCCVRRSIVYLVASLAFTFIV